MAPWLSSNTVECITVFLLQSIPKPIDMSLGAQLVFANNNGKVQTPIDPKSGLPMLTIFHNIDKDRLELAVLSKFQLVS